MRSLLEQERRRLQDLRGRIDERGIQGESQQSALNELSTYDNHPADQGTETFELGRTVATIEHVDAQLDDIETAFRRVEDGSYGRCEVCGAEIPEERLRARPMTRFCLEHQEALEHDLHPRSGTGH